MELEKDYHSVTPNEIIQTMVINGQKHLDERESLPMKALSCPPLDLVGQLDIESRDVVGSTLSHPWSIHIPPHKADSDSSQGPSQGHFHVEGHKDWKNTVQDKYSSRQ